jgi:tetratricopeptide (TPR) repeat protein
MLATWMVCGSAVLLHTTAVRDYIAVLDRLGLRDAPAPSTPLRQVIPARYADAQLWVRHALAAAETGDRRVRFTRADNAPPGREVHWSSAVVWLLRGGATVQSAFTGHGGAFAVERTLLWLNAPLLLGAMLLLSAWTGVRAGAVTGALVALGMVGHGRFYEAFAPANVDHHGLVGAAVLGLVLGVGFMSAGWFHAAAVGGDGVLLPASPASARKAAVASALAGAIGLWLSAAATVPVIALSGLTGLAAAVWFGPAARRAGAEFDPFVWRRWGRVGAGAGLVLYFLEYAPAHFSLRLEANHPLYALAWWGGGELVAQIATWRLARDGPVTPAFPFSGPRLLGAAAAVLAAPLVALVAGRAAFSLSDPFIGELRHFVAEGKSMPAFIRLHGLAPLRYELGLALALLPAAFLVARRGGAGRLPVATLALLAVALLAMAGCEVRWRQTAAVAQIALFASLVGMAVSSLPDRRRGWLVGVAALVFLVPAIQRIVVARAGNAADRVAAGDLLPPLYRDIAAALRESQPQGDIVLLASPNASAGVAYFGRFGALGTLYWENAAGLRAAAKIFSAASDEEAFTRIRARQATHIALIPAANFLGEYHALLHPAATADDARKTFGYRLAAQRSPPPWLQPVPYRPPADLRSAAGDVRLYKVAPDQSEVEWLYHTAIAHLAAGNSGLAEKTLEAAGGRVPDSVRATLWAAGGSAFYDYGSDAIAARLLHRALALAYDPKVALTAAWVLATSRDPAVRDGIAALMLAEPVAQAAPTDPAAWSAVAAAHAELGRFAAAIIAVERAIAATRAGGDPAALALLQQRLDTFRAGRPWRQ